MSDAQSVKIGVKPSILEFSAIVTPDVLDLDVVVVHTPICEAPEDILHFSLIEYNMHPSESRIVINNYEAI